MALSIFIKVFLLARIIAVVLGGKKPCKDNSKTTCTKYKAWGDCEKSSVYFRYVSKWCCETCKVHICDRGDNGGCAQFCKPDGPGRKCTCEPNYKLSDDGMGCEIKHPGDYRHHMDQVEIAACVKNANSYRRKHAGTDDMEWDDDLAAEASKYANYLMKKSVAQDLTTAMGIPGKFLRPYMKHASLSARKAANSGENLFMGYGRKSNCFRANFNWYMEIQYWDFSRNAKSLASAYEGNDVGHFTQLVWKGTKKFGIGIAVEEKFRWPLVLIVGRYSPPGNYNNLYAENVGSFKGKLRGKTMTNFLYQFKENVDAPENTDD